VAAALGLLFWLVLGTIVVRWYDRKHLYRLQPEILAHVNKSIQEYQTKHATPAPPTAPTDAAQRPSSETGPNKPQAAG
jgi:hypothetical protein